MARSLPLYHGSEFIGMEQIVNLFGEVVHVEYTEALGPNKGRLDLKRKIVTKGELEIVLSLMRKS